MDYILSGRRGGKTTAMIMRLAEDLRRGVKTVIVCPYYSMARRPLCSWLRALKSICDYGGPFLRIWKKKGKMT